MKVITSIISVLFCAAIAITINGCVASEKVKAKTGAQLWAENCIRCHNTPSPNSFNDEQWETVGMHMQTRALLTNDEREKIVKFLQQN
jgi:cytochrome c553